MIRAAQKLNILNIVLTNFIFSENILYGPPSSKAKNNSP